MRSALVLLASAVLAAGGMVAAPAAASAEPAKVSRPGVYRGYAEQLYDEWVRTSQYVTVRDGTKLAVDLYRPAVDGRPVDTPYPVIWEHQLGRAQRNQDGTVTLRGVEHGMAELTKYGYVIAYVDRRGNGASYGTMTGYHSRTEARDAYDITEWLARQPWSDGNVGIYGCSNTGEAAMHAATAMPPHLKAVFAGNYAFHKYDGFNRGGIRANWGSGPDRDHTEDLRNLPVDADTDGSMLREAVAQHADNTSLAKMWASAPYRDSVAPAVGTRPWEAYSVATYADRIEKSGVAIYSWDGWYDDFRKETFVSAASLSNPHKVLVGPWEHCGHEGFDLNAERHRFFDHWLKGIDNGIMEEPPVHYATVGSDGTVTWRDAQAWPPPAKPVTYHLHGGPSGTVDSVNDGVLSTKPPRSPDARDVYPVTYDLTCPEPIFLTQTCPQDEHGLTYTTAPLESDLEVTGHPVVSLSVSSTATDGNFFVYLEDVAPDGSVKIVTDGRLKASLRATHDAPYDVLGTPWHRSLEADAVPLTPGERVTLAIDLLPTSYVFEAGHRLRLTVTGADVRESNRTERTPPPEVTLYRGADGGSSLVLPTR